MSKCCGNSDSRFFANSNAGVCDVCAPTEVSPREDRCICPPIGEPRCLNMLAPVIFDESGINLCRVVDVGHLVDACNSKENCPPCTDLLFGGLKRRDLENAENIQLQVVDIDFNFVCPTSNRHSEIRPVKDKPNCSRITLKDIDVTFAVKILNDDCKVQKEGFMVLRYLPPVDTCGFDEETNPSAITLDLYTPYGISFAPENPCGCNKLVPTINFIGFIEDQGDHKNCCRLGEDGAERHHICREYEMNNAVRQGISAQALAKVIANDEGEIAIGLTLYIKVLYLVQYRVPHAGLVVPPKFEAVSEQNDCKIFVEGDLLEQSIKPLEVGVRSKTIRNPNRRPCVNESAVEGIRDEDCKCCN